MSRDLRHQADGLRAPDAPDTPWLCVAGAKGGVGKTMLATNLALLLARAGYRTLLVDLDLGTGNVGVQLRLQGRLDVDDVAAGRCTVEQALVPAAGRLHALLGRSGPSALGAAGADELDALLRELRRASAAFDVVVFDTGAGLNASTLAVAERSDLTLGIATPEVTALTDAYALCKLLHQRGVPLPRLVVNRTRSRDEAMTTAKKLATITERFLGDKTELCGWIGQHHSVEQSTRSQRPLALGAQVDGLEDLRSVCAAALAALPPLTRSASPGPARSVRLRPAPA